MTTTHSRADALTDKPKLALAWARARELTVEEWASLYGAHFPASPVQQPAAAQDDACGSCGYTADPDCPTCAPKTAPSPADERATQISDYLNAPGMWAQVYCCAVFVRGWPSDMARSAADEAVKEFGDAACKTVADLTHTLDEVLRAD